MNKGQLSVALLTTIAVTTISTIIITKAAETILGSDISHAQIEKTLTANINDVKQASLKKDGEQDVKIATIEEAIKQIPTMNNKLDSLLLERGINPKTIK